MYEVANGSTIYIQSEQMINSAGTALTALGDVLLKVQRTSDNFYLDFNDLTFKAAGWTTIAATLTVIDATNDPGRYEYSGGLDLSAITNGVVDDSYTLLISSATAVNSQSIAILYAGYHKVVDLGKVSGDATAADNLELDYDGTGYNKSNSTIGTCTTNTDMRGTDSAALASVCTESRLTELDAGSLPTDVDNVKSDTAAILLDTGTDGVVVAAASKTGYALSSAGIQAIWDALTSALTTVGSVGKKLADWVLGSDNKSILSNNAHTGAVIPNVTLVDTTTANADMRGTDNAALAISYTATRAGYLDDLVTITTNVADIQTRLPAALVGGKMDSDTTAISGSTDAADKLEASAEINITGAAIAGTLSTTQMTTNLAETTDDHYNGRIIIFTSGVLLGQATDITDYVGGSKLLVFTATTEAPSAADTFVIL